MVKSYIPKQKDIDFVACNATFKEKLCDETYEQVLNIINSFIEIEGQYD